ncbi:DoxX family protein [Stieleria sp. JC731]|uniref:DoxX family protein n=1 Tax=Pirellulaceae TaxID=2691357 RepID=UPI001E61D56A|nr:DoxX family protein [Stieleria sp. JC731]MCC9599434.1 DoxX family protein [Stieleria sp. JC731]
MKKSKIVGWVLSVLVFLMMAVLSAQGKFFDFENKEEMFAKLGWAEDVMVYIGIVEVAIAILFLIPRTAFIGAILISAYLGGAVATHVRISDPFIFPIILGVIVWVALGLRDRRVFQLAFGSQPLSTQPLSTQPLSTAATVSEDA